MSALRAALRIAYRDALRAKGRSVLVLAMIGLPMFALAFSDVAVRTSQLSAGERARRALGTADLVTHRVLDGPLHQYAADDYSTPATAGGQPSPDVPRLDRTSPADVLALLPRGSRAEPRDTWAVVPVEVPGRVAPATVFRMDTAGPLSRGLVFLRSGRLPRAGGETALTRALAHTLGVGIGGSVTIGRPAVTYRVTGLVVLPETQRAAAAYVPPSAPAPAGVTRTRVWAVALPPGARDLDAMAALNAHGWLVSPRTWFFHPPPRRGPGPGGQSAGVLVVVLGLATLEIVLLAGTAFAVGARRQRRALALVAATGGDRRDVRRIVLSGAAVLGAAASALGITAGIAVVAAYRPFAAQRLSGTAMGPLDIRPYELGAIVLVGAGTALLAALLPARAAARQPVVAALTGRRGQLHTPYRVPILAVLAIVAGTVLAYASAAATPVRFSLLLAGAVVAELGFVACAPSLVGLVGRAGGRLPLPLRLAARDAARHRARSGPAVAAVVAAVAGSVAISVYLASDTELGRQEYQPRVLARTVVLSRHDMANPLTDADVDAVARALPVRERIDYDAVGRFCVGRGPCTEWSLSRPDGGDTSEVTVGSGGPALVTWVLGRVDDAALAAYRSGAVVVTDPRWVVDGHVALRAQTFGKAPHPTVRLLTLPAVVARAPFYSAVPVAVVPPDVLRRNNVPTHPEATVFTTTRLPTAREEAAALAVGQRSQKFVDLYVERGYTGHSAAALLALLAAATLVTVGATAIATGLAAADSRPDLATLAAVGAAPRVRRTLAMAQAVVVAGLGSGLGLLAGLIPAVSIVSARTGMPLVLPWPSLLVTAVAVPLLAALLVGAATRSRLPVVRRLA
jgi:putative ABC transport system permease protein